jgi:uncharacterized protein
MKDNIPFLDKRLSIEWFENVGLGVVAGADIEKGIFIEVAPVVVCDNNSIASDKEAFKYVIAWNDKLAVPLGWTMIYNHSDNNNCEFSTNIHDNLLAIMTIRKIERGEQITVNYGDHWFSSRGIKKEPI